MLVVDLRPDPAAAPPTQTVPGPAAERPLARAARIVGRGRVDAVTFDVALPMLAPGAYCLHASLVGLPEYARRGLDDTYAKAVARAHRCGLRVSTAAVRAAQQDVEKAASEAAAAEAATAAEVAAAAASARETALRAIASGAADPPTPTSRPAASTPVPTQAQPSTPAPGAPDGASAAGFLGGESRGAPVAIERGGGGTRSLNDESLAGDRQAGAADGSTMASVAARSVPSAPLPAAVAAPAPIGQCIAPSPRARWWQLLGVPAPPGPHPSCTPSPFVHLQAHAFALPTYSTAGVDRNATLLAPLLRNSSAAWSVSVHYSLVENCTQTQCSVFHRVEAGRFIRTPALFVRGSDQAINLQVRTKPMQPWRKRCWPAPCPFSVAVADAVAAIIIPLAGQPLLSGRRRSSLCCCRVSPLTSTPPPRSCAAR